MTVLDDIIANSLGAVDFDFIHLFSKTARPFYDGTKFQAGGVLDITKLLRQLAKKYIYNPMISEAEISLVGVVWEANNSATSVTLNGSLEMNYLSRPKPTRLSL